MVIFLLTDIEKSTEKWEKHSQAMGKALALHDEIMRSIIPKHGGRIIKHTGDGVFAVFDGGTPLACALEIQLAIQQTEWADIGELRVRTALHSGETEQREKDYFGSTINRAARLLSAGWGGQILLTEQAQDYLSLPKNATFQDLGVHTLKDISEPLHIFQLLSPELRLREFPPLKTLSSCPNNLPQEQTPFVGRQDEVAEIKRIIMAEENRLLSIVGPGGMGKTRLALKTAEELLGEFPFGVFYVQLAPLLDVNAIIPAIAGALGFTFYRQDDPKKQLSDYLQDKEILLIMDNFEHLLTANSLVADLLTNTKLIKIIVTSRERLNLSAEAVFAIKGLPYPAAEEQARSVEYPAIQLFLDRVLRHHSAFQPTPDEMDAIIKCCRILEGLPLGIEIAASWIPFISCQELLAELDKSIIALSSPTVDLPDRHKSLHAVFDYSWQLLDEDLRSLLSRFTVFRGSFSRSAAEKITGATMQTLLSLCNKSLLAMPAQGRFALAMPLKQYLVEKNRGEAQEFNETAAVHCRFFADFLAERTDALSQSSSKLKIREIAIELDEIRAAWAWAMENKDAGSLSNMVLAFHTFMDRSGYFPEGYQCFSSAYSAFSSDTDAEDQKLIRNLLLSKAKFEVRLTRYDDALHSAEEMLALARQVGLAEYEADALGVTGEVQYKRGRLDEAEEVIKRAVNIYEQLGIVSKQMYNIQLLAMMEGMKGNYERSAELYNECIAKASNNGDLAMSTRLKLMYAQATRYSKNYNEAIRIYTECLEILKETGDRVNYAGSLNNLSVILDTIGRSEEALVLQEESLAIKRQIGDSRSIAISLGSMGVILIHIGNSDYAAKCFEEAIRITEENKDRTNLSVSLLNYGHLHLLKGDLEEGKIHIKRGFELANAIGYISVVVDSLFFLAFYHYKSGNSEKAVELISFTRNQFKGIDTTGRDLDDVLKQISSGIGETLFAQYSQVESSLTMDEVAAFIRDL